MVIFAFEFSSIGLALSTTIRVILTSVRVMLILPWLAGAGIMLNIFTLFLETELSKVSLPLSPSYNSQSVMSRHGESGHPQCEPKGTVC